MHLVESLGWITISKVRFISNSSNRIVGLQFDLRVGLVFPTQRKSIVFWQGQLPCWKLLVYLQGSSCHFESMASMENTIPLGYLNMKSFQWYLETLLISSVSGCPISWVFWFRDHLQWWTSSSILKEDSPLLQEHSFLSIHRSFPNGLGCFLSHPQPLVCGIRKSQDSTLHNIGSNVVILKNDSEVSFWIEISFIFSWQFISGCLYEQTGRHPLLGNMYLNLHNHGLIKCQNDSDSRKYILGNLDVLPDSLSRSLVIQTKGAMSRQVFNQLDMFCPGPWSCR